MRNDIQRLHDETTAYAKPITRRKISKQLAKLMLGAMLFGAVVQNSEVAAAPPAQVHLTNLAFGTVLIRDSGGKVGPLQQGAAGLFVVTSAPTEPSAWIQLQQPDGTWGPFVTLMNGGRYRFIQLPSGIFVQPY